MQTVIGLDVGGANTKAAHVGDDGAVALSDEPFEVWRAPEGLSAAIGRVVERLRAPDAAPVALTTTAELVDVFADKPAGVRAVLAAATRALGARRIEVLRTDGTLVPVAAAAADPLPCAAANWMASARLLARTVPDAILVDCGSTTTDLIPIAGGEVAARGRTDVQRLCAAELVYTGALRTNLATLLRSVTVGGVACPVASEQFAVSADAHRLLGHLTAEQCTAGFPDGRGAGLRDVRRRLARLVCADPGELPDGTLEAIAAAAHEAQVDVITAALGQVRARTAPDAPVLAVGVGAFLAAAAAARAGIRCLPAHDEPLSLRGAGGVVAPAVALSILGRD